MFICPKTNKPDQVITKVILFLTSVFHNRNILSELSNDFAQCS